MTPVIRKFAWKIFKKFAPFCLGLNKKGNKDQLQKSLAEKLSFMKEKKLKKLKSSAFNRHWSC